MLLDGHDPAAVNAYAASTFYAVDRFASYRQDWGEYYEQGGLILSDRYTTSNAVHQTTKEPPEKRQAFLHWLYDFEFRKMGLPVPDAVVFLDMAPEVANRLIAARAEKTGAREDIHERDKAYLARCHAAYLALAEKYGWARIPCSEGSAPRPVAAIHEDVWRALAPVLGNQEETK